MNILGRIIDEREDRRTAEDEADDLWLKERGGIEPAERRAAWRRWLRRELEKTLQWPTPADARDRLIGQCAAELTTLARQLRGRGWLLDGAALAGHVRELLGPVAKAQQAGKVGDFWPYFRATVRRYVEAKADEISRQARRSGADEGAQSMAAALAVFDISKAVARREPSMTELLAARGDENARERLAKQAAENAQMRLL